MQARDPKRELRDLHGKRTAVPKMANILTSPRKEIEAQRSNLLRGKRLGSVRARI